MVAEAVALSTKAGKATESDKCIMGEVLNYCPVIAVDGTIMKPYDTNRLLQQLKRAYAERAVRNGFDDTNLYNDELLKMDGVALEEFKKLKGIVGISKVAPKTNDIDINDQGFEVTYSWEGAYNANVTITNTSNEKIENWCIEFPLNESIQNIWNAKIENRENGYYTIKNADWNQDIAVGSTVSFGFTAEGDFTEFPDYYSILGTVAQVSADDYDILYKVESDWETGFTGQIIITNKTDTTIEDWALEFDFNNDINDIWNAEVSSYEDGHYFVSNAGYNQNIAAGQSVNIGFKVDQGSSENIIQNVQLTKVDTEENNIVINIDYSDFTYSEADNLYFVSDVLENISGSIENIDIVKSLEYKISTLSGYVVSSGPIEIKEMWSFSDFNLIYGTNNVIITATDNNGREISAAILLYNSNINNMRSLEQDEGSINDLLAEDNDGDNLCDFVEAVIGTDSFNPDTNGDGITDDNADMDADGVSNKEEIERYTNPISNDTDEDGLLDGEELYTYYTNPCSRDTDGDQASDKWEIENGYDPTVYNDSFSVSAETAINDNIKNVSVTLEDCDGSAAETLSISKVENSLLNDEIPGYIGDCCEFTADGSLGSAKTSYTLDENLFSEDSFIPTLYYFNENTQLLEEVENQEIDGNVVSAIVPHFSKYLLLNKTKYESSWNYTLLYDEDGTDNYKGIDVVFAIDSSGSMTSNDRDGVRKTVTEDFIDILTDNDRAAVVDFDSSALVRTSFTSDKDALYAAVNKIDSYGGTNLSSAVSAAINLFTYSTYEGDGKAKYIVMLTDGIGTYSQIYTSMAEDNDIIIYTIGLGSSTSVAVLNAIAEGTGGEYYHADEANKLYGIFDTIADMTDLNKDSDSDGLCDYFEKEMNSGNLRLGTGVKLTGLNYLDADTDGDGLTDGEELSVCKVNNKVYVYMKSNPTSVDTDGDGLLDGSARMVDNKKVAPKDPNPLYANGPIGIWQAQYQQEVGGNIPHEYGDSYPIQLDLSM
ncbi:MAG: cellulose binding domain-containing protein, partial [Lachnospiraceae bacterium]|nr:cellulose binding domain-containing protein [Lachnospiraceae bacterium]